jgi:hypothetical protein
MYTWNTFNNYGYLLVDVNDNILNILKLAYAKSKFYDTEPNNHNLAGQLENEINLKELIPDVKDYFNHLAQLYVKHFGCSLYPDSVLNASENKWQLSLGNLWMNIQKKYEYNPIHTHSGELSFALWLQIPYDIEYEKSLSNAVNSKKPCNGDFMFHPIMTDGRLDTVPMNVGKNMEGKLAIFPSSMLHSVSPFYTSDGERVSVSGNWFYEQIK